MANYIDIEAFIGWLKTIPLKDLSDGLGLCRVIMEEDFKRCIKNVPESAFIDAVPVEEHERLKRELQNCRDELCLHCGNYKRAHLGACNGCRWKEM